MNRNKMVLIASTFALAIGSAFVTKVNAARPLTTYFENTTGCPASACSSAGALPCGHIVYLSGCQTQITNAKRN